MLISLKIKPSIIVFVCFCGIISITLSSNTARGEKKNNIIKIGAISVLSGEGASWGVNHQRGSLLAAEEANARGGINGRKIKLIFEDSSGGLARNGVAAYSKLVHADGVKFILGPVTMDEMLAIAPLVDRDHVFIGGATYMPGSSENFFSTWIDADIESDLIAEHVSQRYKRIAILASQQSWESQIAQRFKAKFTKLGGEVVLLEEPSFEVAEVKSEVLKVKQRLPDAVFITSYLLFPKYIREIKALGIKAPLYSIELDQAVIDNAGAGSEGLVFIAPSAPSRNFVENFQKRWKQAPDIPAASAYDAATLLFRAIAENGEDVSKVAVHFRDFKGFDGVTGHIERREGRTMVSTSYYIVLNGKISPYVLD